jgi:hypothetical protein
MQVVKPQRVSEVALVVGTVALPIGAVAAAGSLKSALSRPTPGWAAR